MSIMMHSEFGLAPTMTVCRYCGEETNEVALLGIKADKIMKELYKLSDGKLGNKDGYQKFGKNKILSGNMCDACQKIIDGGGAF